MQSLTELQEGVRLQPPLLTADQVPAPFREPAIFTGYRPFPLTPVQCVVSVFNATNETLNFWTHFIPTWYFVWRLADLGTSMDFLHDPYTRGLLVYMTTCCVYPLISCTAHAFSSLSDKARHICYFFDYGALSLYSLGAGILYRSYALPRDMLEDHAGRWDEGFLCGCVVCAIVCTLSACCSRFTGSKLALKTLRLGAFALPFAWVSLPLLHRLLHCADAGECGAPSLTYHARQFAVALFGAFVYALHVPERLAPGRFDIVGHSHQWLHVCGILATNEQMNGALLDLGERRELITRNGWTLSESWILGATLCVLLADVAIIGAFSLCVLRKDKSA